MTNDKLPSLRIRDKISDPEHVYSELSRSIMMGEFMPGQKLKLAELAEVFGTSHMPVREALSRLVVARVLEAAPRKSAFIPQHDAKRLDDLLAVRLKLECMAVEIVAARPKRALASKLTLINGMLDREGEKKNPSIKAYLASNHEFHFTLYRECGNEDLISIIEFLWMRYGPLLNYLREKPFTYRNHDRHAAIIEGVEAGDSDLACGALRADLEEAAEGIRLSFGASADSSLP
jgi:DNA-binding GntR family transcriptional regulator